MAGQPTSPDVEKLDIIFVPNMARDGTVIPWGALEEVLQLKRTMIRFQTVLRRWRKHILVTKGLFLDGMKARGQGLMVCTSRDMVAYGAHGLPLVQRVMNRRLTVTQHAHGTELNQVERRQQEHLVKYYTSALSYMTQTRSTLPIPLRPKDQGPRAEAPWG